MRQLFGPSKDEMWQELSRQLGAEFVDGGFWKADRVEARRGPWIVTLDTYVVSTGKSSITYTRLRAPYVNRDGLRFHIYRSTLFTGIGKALGMQDIPIGDPDFDREFVIKGNDVDQIRLLLADEELRALLRLQPSLSFHIDDDEGWFGPRFSENVDQLVFNVVGVIKDIERLKALFDLFAATLHRLCVIGSAYETDPLNPAPLPHADALLRPSDGAANELLRPAAGASAIEESSLLRPADDDTTAR